MRTSARTDEAWQTCFHWVQRNRLRPQREYALGEALGRWIKGELENQHDAAALWTETLYHVVDESFRRHCRISTRRGSELVIMVDAAGLVDPMRRRWSGAIRDALSQMGARGRKLKVQFVYEPHSEQGSSR